MRSQTVFPETDAKDVAHRATRDEANGRLFWWIHKQTPKGGPIRIEKSVGSLPLLKQKLEKRGVRSASAQLAHVCNKMFTTLESKGILRTAPEEFMLASQYRPDDELFAEFIRTFRTTFFSVATTSSVSTL